MTEETIAVVVNGDGQRWEVPYTFDPRTGQVRLGAPRPWYERASAPLAPEEVDGYDRLMAPERLPRRGPLFGGR